MKRLVIMVCCCPGAVKVRKTAWSLPCHDSWPGMPSEWLAKQDDVLHVIRSQEELDRFSVPAESEFKTEFGKYSVLLVAGTSNSGIAKITRSLTYKGGGKYAFTVEITRNAATVMQPWRVAVLAPAIPEDAKIDLKSTIYK